MTNGQRPPTSVDVARLAGVSRTTVSYVLNDTPNLSIKPETRERVLAAARELNYQLQPAAQALRKGQSDDIFFVADRPLTLFVRELIRVYQRRARELGYTMFVCFADEMEPEEQRNFLLRIFANRPAGVIANAGIISRTELETMPPTASVGLSALEKPSRGPEITIQAFEAGKLMGEHFVSRGHRRIGLVAPQAIYLAEQVEERRAALRSSLAGLDAPDVRLYPVASSSLADARQVAAALAADPVRPSAIFGFNDEYSLPLLRAVQELGLRVPQDIVVAGTDNLAFGELCTPTLTTINFDINALGTRIIDVVDAKLRGTVDEVEWEPLPAPILIPRESTAN